MCHFYWFALTVIGLVFGSALAWLAMPFLDQFLSRFLDKSSFFFKHSTDYEFYPGNSTFHLIKFGHHDLADHEIAFKKYQELDLEISDKTGKHTLKRKFMDLGAKIRRA